MQSSNMMRRGATGLAVVAALGLLQPAQGAPTPERINQVIVMGQSGDFDRAFELGDQECPDANYPESHACSKWLDSKRFMTSARLITRIDGINIFQFSPHAETPPPAVHPDTVLFAKGTYWAGYVMRPMRMNPQLVKQADEVLSQTLVPLCQKGHMAACYNLQAYRAHQSGQPKPPVPPQLLAQIREKLGYQAPTSAASSPTVGASKPAPAAGNAVGENATHCVSVKAGVEGVILVNSCPYVVEAIWCTEGWDCQKGRYSNMATIQANNSWPSHNSKPNNYTRFAACKGRNSITSYGAKDFSWEFFCRKPY